MMPPHKIRHIDRRLMQQSAWRNCPKSPGGTRNWALEGTQRAPFGPFWSRNSGQIHARSIARTPFRTVSEGEFCEVRALRVLGTLLLAKNLDTLGRPSLPGLHPLTVASYNVILVSVDGISARAATPSPTRSGAASTKLWVTGKPTSCLSTTMRESM